MSQKLVITITPEGIKVDAAGFTGGKCIVEQDALERFLNQTAGITTKGKTQKKKLEQMYHTAPGQQAKY